MEKAYEKLLRYVAIDTQSDDDSETTPSTMKQFDLANLLVEELKNLGIEDAHVDEHCYLYGTLKANVANAPKIGLIAHFDTSPDYSGKDVKPQIIRNYDGSDIVLNKELNLTMPVKDFPALTDLVGQDLITTDGTTLLGADDKAGIAEIMSVIEYFVNNPEVKHGDIKIGFTPDEEIGRGADKFDVAKFGADFAYTLDGDALGSLEFENFNAANPKITIHGKNIHPGSAKNKMKNSVVIAMELLSMLPTAQRPEHTENYEGFFHCNDIEGSVEKTSMIFLVRDHNMAKFEEKKALMVNVVNFLNAKYGEGTVELSMKDAYYNMEEQVKPVFHIVESAKTAMEKLGIKPIVKPIRGGTDGSRLSFMGLPTPNLFTGGQNFHGRFEFISINTMDKAVETVVEIIKTYAEK